MNLSKNSQENKQTNQKTTKSYFSNIKRLFQLNLTLNLWNHFPFGHKLVHPSSLGNIYSKYSFAEAQTHVRTTAKHLPNILVSWEGN